MTPLRITAHLAGPLMRPSGGTIMLDSLLMSVVARQMNLPPPATDHEPVDIPIPVARDERTGLHLCTDALAQVDAYEVRYLRRRFPVPEAIAFGDRGRPVNVNPSGGLTKSTNRPDEMVHPERGIVRWYALGDADAVRELLGFVTHLGKMRGHGHGEVLRWQVEPCSTWEGFPVLYQGRPLRALPLDWPGLDARAQRDYRVLRPPYYWRAPERTELCAVPGEGEAQP